MPRGTEVEDDTEDAPVLRGTETDPVPVGPAEMLVLVLVPLPYGELSVLDEDM